MVALPGYRVSGADNGDVARPLIAELIPARPLEPDTKTPPELKVAADPKFRATDSAAAGWLR